MDLALASVASLMTRKVVTLTPNHALPLASDIMQRGRFRHLPVVDDKGKLVGMVTHRDILAAQTSSLAAGDGDKIPLEVPIGDVMTRELLTCSPLMAAHLAAQILVEQKIGSLPVIDEGKLVGIVTEADFVAYAARELGRHQRIEVDDIMTTDVVTLAPDWPLDLASDLIELRRIRHLPVVDERRRVVGMITHRDLVAAQRSALTDERKFPRTATAAEIARPDVWTVSSGTAVHDAARLLADHQFGCLPVIADGAVVGIVTEADILQLIVRLVARRGASRTNPVVTHYMSRTRIIRRDDTLAEAHRVMEVGRATALAVLSESGKLLGVISASDLLEVPLDKLDDESVADHMTREVVTTGWAGGIGEAARAMVEHGIHQVFVTDDTSGMPTVVGVLDAGALFAVCRDLRAEQPISELTRPTTFTIDVGEPIAGALNFLERVGVRGLIVVDHDWPVGVLGQLDLLRARGLPPETPVERVMSQRFIKLIGTTPLFRASGQAAELGLDRILVSLRDGWGVISGLDLASAVVRWL